MLSPGGADFWLSPVSRVVMPLSGRFPAASGVVVDGKRVLLLSFPLAAILERRKGASMAEASITYAFRPFRLVRPSVFFVVFFGGVRSVRGCREENRKCVWGGEGGPLVISVSLARSCRRQNNIRVYVITTTITKSIQKINDGSHYYSNERGLVE